MRFGHASFLRRPRFGALCVWLLISGAACGGDDGAANGAAGAAADGGASEPAAGSGGKAGSVAGASGAKAGAGGHAAGASGGMPGTTAGASGRAAGASGSNADAGDAGVVCNLACVQGQHCELIEVTCVRAPCPAQPMCIADSSNAGLVDCDPSKVLCKRATPKCAGGQVPSVVGSCYGDCVPFELCGCAKASECPLPDQYTCHMSAGHCGPYVE